MPAEDDYFDSTKDPEYRRPWSYYNARDAELMHLLKKHVQEKLPLLGEKAAICSPEVLNLLSSELGMPLVVLREKASRHDATTCWVDSEEEKLLFMSYNDALKELTKIEAG